MEYLPRQDKAGSNRPNWARCMAIEEIFNLQQKGSIIHTYTNYV